MKGYLGIDVSKGYADFTLLDENKNELEKVYQLDDTRSGHDTLTMLLEKQIEQHHISMLYCAVESTGGFENNWYATLHQLCKKMNVKATRLNPSGVKKNMEAGLNRNVTDALSSRYIGEYLISQDDKVVYEQQSSHYATFRSVNKHIQLQNKQQTQLINQLKIILYSAFPELMCYCKNTMPGWVLEVLKRYPTAAQISKLDAPKLAKVKHVTPDKAQRLINKAKTSVASRTNNTQGFLIKSIARQLLDKQPLIMEHKNYLEKNCTGEAVTLIDSITGIGPYSAAAIMTEIENIERFESPKHLVSYFGLHPELKDSGDKKGVHRMSKKGRPSMRAILYMCAQSAVIYDAHFKKVYHNNRCKAMSHKQAIGVIMQKMLRVIWGVLTHKQPYQPAVDIKNQEKKVVAISDSKVKETKAKRRFQTLDTQAPISGKQTKTRKAYSESQVSNAEQVRDHQNTPV